MHVAHATVKIDAMQMIVTFAKIPCVTRAQSSLSWSEIFDNSNVLSSVGVLKISISVISTSYLQFETTISHVFPILYFQLCLTN